MVAKFQVAPWKSGTFHGVRGTFQDWAFGEAWAAKRARLTPTMAITDCLVIVNSSVT
jgi:hypothetical protein